MRPPVLSRPPRLSDELFRVLQSRIQAGDYPLGAQIPTEKALAEQFGVSRSVVREAVSRLKADGYVETRQGAGAFVTGVHARHFSFCADAGEAADIRHVFELRAAVETEAAALAADRRTTRDLLTIRHHLACMDQALREERDATEDDDQFHIAIAAATQNPYLVSFTEFLGRQFSDSRRLAWSAQGRSLRAPHGAQAEHHELVAAIAAGDAATARAIARRHVAEARGRLGVSA